MPWASLQPMAVTRWPWLRKDCQSSNRCLPLAKGLPRPFWYSTPSKPQAQTSLSDVRPKSVGSVTVGSPVSQS